MLKKKGEGRKDLLAVVGQGKGEKKKKPQQLMISEIEKKGNAGAVPNKERQKRQPRLFKKKECGFTPSLKGSHTNSEKM